ncbi:hypothetical protein EWH21_08170 [Pseudomonas sp. REST10]|uniref:hypothetical protein n=1 Tax=Pseudomonas sp. REST10 TaxID=2512235 RepID=UPI00240E4513|nr:hypothetical protein [Pseudomonas sp. REST10]WFC61698.1 hypothetical protein EWH21_08170 [Pseudomonas sp. REST10]
MFYRILLATLLILPLGGCAVYGYDHDRGYRNHAYYKGYRHDYSPPVYVTSRYYYDDRRRQYQAPPHYVPAPQPRQRYGYAPHYRDDYKRHEQPRHDRQRDARRQEQRGVKVLRGWDTGRSTPQRYSNGRSYSEQRRSNERRW